MRSLRDAVAAKDQPSHKALLSPFTWNNLTLPPLNKHSLSVSGNSKPYHNTNTLAIIAEASKKGRYQKQGPKGKLSQSIDRKQRTPEQSNTIATEAAKVLHKPKKNRRANPPLALNKTIDVKAKESQVVPRHEATISTSEPCKRIRFLSSKHNMEQYLKMSLNRAGWKQSLSPGKHTSNADKQEAELVWANIDRPTDHIQIGKGSFYNHITGTHHLTTKNGLHHQLADRGYSFYPRSFLIPENYEDFLTCNTQRAVLTMARDVAGDILGFMSREKMSFDWKDRACLGEVLQSSILQTGNEETSLLIKLCMYLEVLRVEKGYIGYFENVEGYQKISIKPKPALFQSLINEATTYFSQGSSPRKFDYSQIDYRLLVLLLHYDRMLELLHPSYGFPSFWIVKPIASSRGAGISVLRSSPQFCWGQDNERAHFKNRKKYENKVIQQYITNPFLLDRGEFMGRKFDIRQWVLLVSRANGVTAYRYHTGYCRFAAKQFTLSKLDREIHLTNYSLLKIEDVAEPSTLMLQELFSASKDDLRSKYFQQCTSIIYEAIAHSRKLRPQEGCFELLGFDFLLDSASRLHLLQINLNPACAASRYAPLKAECAKMTESMMELVTQRKQSANWVEVVGTGGFNSDDESNLGNPREIQVKPFYEYHLAEKESLIGLIRQRKRRLLAMVCIINRYYARVLIDLLTTPVPQTQNLEEGAQGGKGSKEEAAEGEGAEMRFIQERSTSYPGTQLG